MNPRSPAKKLEIKVEDITGTGTNTFSGIAARDASSLLIRDQAQEKEKGSQTVSAREPDSQAQATSQQMPEHSIDIRYLVKALIKYSASDLHIKPGRPPLYRVNGKLIPAKMKPLVPEQVHEILMGLMNERQVKDLHRKLQVDLSFGVENLGRFRCNAFFQRGHLSAVIRTIPLAARGLQELGVPLVLKDLSLKRRGLILVTGATGSGKSTTLAAMINHINDTRAVHILTIEDPIEFMFKDSKASITQREIGNDAVSFREALIAGLRQDPDVIMVGEMRDPETIHTAITAAETGHLVLATLHTESARGTIDRILDVFPSDQQNQIRLQLGNVLLAVVSQRLLARADGNGRIPACEVMVKSPSIEEAILGNHLDKLSELMATSSDYYRMQTLNVDLLRLVRAHLITEEEALRSTSHPDDLRLLLSGVDRESFHS